MARTVGSRELKTRLGTYLRLVRAGRTVVITDRGRPVAELAPLRYSKDRVRAILEEMAAEGRVTLPKTGRLRRVKPIRILSGPTLSETLREMREDRI